MNQNFTIVLGLIVILGNLIQGCYAEDLRAVDSESRISFEARQARAPKGIKPKPVPKAVTIELPLAVAVDDHEDAKVVPQNKSGNSGLEAAPVALSGAGKGGAIENIGAFKVNNPLNSAQRAARGGLTRSQLPGAHAAADAHYEELLEQFDTFMLGVTHTDWTKRDIGQAVTTFLLSGGLCLEPWGEREIWVTQFLYTYGQTIEGYRYQYIGIDSYNRIAQLKAAILGLYATAYGTYIPYRMSLLTDKVTPDANKRKITHHFGWCREALGYGAAGIAALAMAAVPAIDLYTAEVAGNYESTGRLLAPYVGLYYAFDYFLRFTSLKDRLFTRFFMGDTPEIRSKREGLVKDILKAKQRVHSMANEEVIAFRAILRQLAKELKIGTNYPTEKSGIKQFKIILAEGRKVPEPEPGSWISRLTKRTAVLLPTAITTAASAYLAYQFGQSAFTNFAEYINTGQTAGQNDVFNQVAYEVFQQDTANITIYNGNYTDWCWQCISSAKEIGDQSYNFLNCPGVSNIADIGATPNDLAYGNYTCNTLFDFLQYSYAQLAGAITGSDDSSGTPPYVPSMATRRTIDFFSGLYAAGTTMLGVPGGLTYFSRTRDMFSNTPEEVLPGRKSKLYNLGNWIYSTAMAALRASPEGMMGWYIMNSNTNPVFMWTVITLATFNKAEPYANDFIASNNNIPRWAAKSFKAGEDSKLTALVERDELLMELDEIAAMMLKANGDLVFTLDRIKSTASGAMAA